MDRREFCRRAVAGAVGTAALPGLAAARNDPPIGRVNVRDHFEVNFFDVDLAEGYTEYEYDVEGTIPGYTDGRSPEEILFWPNAWDKSREDVNRRFPNYVDSLERAGYDGPSVVFEWPSDDPAYLWLVTAEKARRAGRKFGQFLQDYRRQNPETTIRVVGFSLGSTVALSAGGSLHDRGWDGEVDQLALLGAATGDEELSLDGEYGPGCRAVYGEVDSFYKTDDSTLSRQFAIVERNGALGTAGIEGPPPENYEEHQVDWVDGHDLYWSYERGCIRSVVAEWTDDDARAGSDPSASGPVETPVDEPEVDSFEGSLSGDGDSETHFHEFARDDDGLDRVVIEVTTPLSVDFDCYVAVTGRRATREDYDFRSHSSDPGERIHLDADEVDADAELSLTVASYRGSGEYWVAIREYPATGS